MIYEIKVNGRLDESWTDWLGDVRISSVAGEDGTVTIIVAMAVADSPALFGILNRIRDLNLRLISVRQIEKEQ